MKIDVGEGIVEPIIKEQVAAAVAAQLGDPAKILTKLVEQSLTMKVDARGEPSKWGDARPYLEHVCHETIRKAAKDALQTIVDEQKPVIEKAVRDHLSRAPKRTAAAIVEAFVGNAKWDHGLRVNFEFKRGDED